MLAQIQQYYNQRSGFRAFAFLGLLCGVVAAPSFAQTSPQDNPPVTLPLKPPPVPTGVIPLPQGAPPTGQQAPVPTPAQLLPKADQPLRTSPRLAAINGYVQSRPLTLQDAVAVTLYVNRSFATAVANLQRLQARTGIARSALAPTAGVNAQITEFDNATTANFGAILGGGSTGGSSSNASNQTFVITPQFNPVLTTSFTLPLDLFNTLRSAVSQAQFQEVAARIDVNRVRNQVVYDVKTAFYNVLRAQAQVAVATDNLNNSLTRLDDANKNYAVGVSPRFDIISAQRDVANAQQSLIDARSQVSIDLAALKNTMGIDIRTKISIVDTGAVDYPPGVEPPVVPPIAPNGQAQGATGTSTQSPPPTPSPAPPVDRTQAAPKDPAGNITPLTRPSTNQVNDDFELGPEYDPLVQEALRTRPEILEAEAQITAAQRGVQYARSSSLPSFSASVAYTYTPNAAGFTRPNIVAGTLGVNIPLFDGGLARERVREARADIATAEVNRRQAADQVQVDVQQAYVTLVQARNRVAVANVGLAQAREAFRLARVRYNAGVSQQTGISPQLELSTAQTSLAQAQTNQVNALYDYNNARAQLDRAVGRYSYTGITPGYKALPKPSMIGPPR